MRSLLSLIVVIWVLIGAFAGFQRGYYTGDAAANCARISTIAVTVAAGPLNYFGVNPKVKNCARAPKPSR